MPCHTQKIVARLNKIAITQQASENSLSKKYGANLCSTQADYPLPSKGHLSLINLFSNFPISAVYHIYFSKKAMA